MSTFSEKVKKGLEEILEFEKGKKTLRTRFVELPESPIEYSAKKIKNVRKKASRKSIKKRSTKRIVKTAR